MHSQGSSSVNFCGCCCQDLTMSDSELPDDDWEQKMVKKMRKHQQDEGFLQENSFTDNALFQMVKDDMPAHFYGAMLKATVISRDG